MWQPWTKLCLQECIQSPFNATPACGLLSIGGAAFHQSVLCVNRPFLLRILDRLLPAGVVVVAGLCTRVLPGEKETLQ